MPRGTKITVEMNAHKTIYMVEHTTITATRRVDKMQECAGSNKIILKPAKECNLTIEAVNVTQVSNTVQCFVCGAEVPAAETTCHENCPDLCCGGHKVDVGPIWLCRKCEPQPDKDPKTTQDIIDEEARQEVLDDEAKEREQDIINEEEDANGGYYNKS